MDHLTIELARGYLSGQLDQALRTECEAHLATCTRCRELVEAERAWGHVLELGETRAEEPQSDSAELMAALRAEKVQTRLAGQRRRLRTRVGVQTAITLLLAALLVYQLSRPGRSAATDSTPLPIAPDLQSHVIANLDALQALAKDPWLGEEYETVRMLEAFIASREASGS